MSEIQAFEKNLNIKRKQATRAIKDDRQSKLNLLLSLLSFKSFRITKGRNMANEFGIKSKEYNKQVLKENWLPVSHYLIYRYVSASKTAPPCNASTVNEEATVLKEEGYEAYEKN